MNKNPMKNAGGYYKHILFNSKLVFRVITTDTDAAPVASPQMIVSDMTMGAMVVS